MSITFSIERIDMRFYLYLSSVELSKVFLQQFVEYLYKIELLSSGYSILKGDNAVKQPTNTNIYSVKELINYALSALLQLLVN